MRRRCVDAHVFERGDADARGGDEEVLERDGMRESAESFESERVTKIGVFVRGVSDGGRRMQRARLDWRKKE